MNEQTHTQVLDSLDRLELWIQRNGWAGYDPYDLRETVHFRALIKLAGDGRLARGIERFAPTLTRRLLRVRPKVNAKTIALLALAYLARYEATGRKPDSEQAKSCLEWLKANKQSGYSGACWGYPFDWYTRVKIPAGTPSGVVSSVAGWAFLEAYRLFNESQYLDVAESVAEFFLHDLNLHRLDAHRACFSYTPLDSFHVHNANLFVATHLLTMGALRGKTAYSAVAELAIAYTLEEQNPDGSWYYWGPPDTLRYNIDHYHTGFVLRCLDRLCRLCSREDWEAALKRGFEFYVERLLDPSGIPRFTSRTTFPVDIHSCAEAILCLTQLCHRYPQAKDRSASVLCWVLNEMQSEEGHFYYRKYPRQTVRIAYMRWGQAWMFWALASNVRMLEK